MVLGTLPGTSSILYPKTLLQKSGIRPRVQGRVPTNFHSPYSRPHRSIISSPFPSGFQLSSPSKTLPSSSPPNTHFGPKIKPWVQVFPKPRAGETISSTERYSLGFATILSHPAFPVKSYLQKNQPRPLGPGSGSGNGAAQGGVIAGPGLPPSSYPLAVPTASSPTPWRRSLSSFSRH